MKTFIRSIWLLFILATVAVRAAAPNITPLGFLSGQLHGPARVATDAAGNIYVTDPAAGQVVVFNAFGQPVAVHDGFAGPLAIAIASDGRIYLSEMGSGSVSAFDPQWNFLYAVGIGADEFKQPANLAVDPQSPDIVYVSDGAANLVRVYYGATPVGQFGGAGTGNGQFDFPAGVAVRRNGEVFVVDQNNDRIEVFTNGIYCRQFKLGAGGMLGGPSGRAQALLVDDFGRVFVADSFQSEVKIFDADTGLKTGSTGQFGSAAGQLNLPVGLALDPLNRLCVASANNSRVELFGVDNFLHLSTQTASGNLAAGNDLVISATLGGTNGGTFQWRKDGANLEGATNANLTVANAAAGDSGNYSVVISTSSGVVTSSVTSVSVLASPNILAGPVDQKILVGAKANFSVIATGSALNYQWQFNGQNLADATNATLVLTDAQAAQSGQYGVRVSNPLAAVTTTPANLKVVAPPLVMDTFSSATQPDQTFQLTFNVDPGFDYDLQATTNFTDWQTVTTFSANGLFDFTDTDATNHPNRFYRLRCAVP